MNLGILARKKNSKSKVIPKFVAAADKLGVTLSIYRPSDLVIYVNNGLSIFDKNMEEIHIKGMINWMPFADVYEIDEAINMIGIPMLNHVHAVRNCRNKMLTTILLSNHNISQPDTMFLPKWKTLPQTIPIKAPLVYKRKTGSRGLGSEKFDKLKDMKKFFLDFKVDEDVYLQKYINNYGWDMRVIVVGDKIIGGMKKTAKKGEWRTQVLHGGEAIACEVNNEIANLCIKARRALGIDFAGIDVIMDTEGKYHILEVNSVPGLDLFKKVTGKDISYEILKHLVEVVEKNE